MIAVDTNILIYAHRRESGFHEPASRVMRELAEGRDVWALPWPCCYEFFSVATNPRIWRDAASTQAQAWAQLTAWTQSPSARLIGETPAFLPILESLACRPKVRGAVVHDARIAALCLAHGVRALLSVDRDFTLFPELVTRNPFVGNIVN